MQNSFSNELSNFTELSELAGSLTPERWERMKSVVAQRTRLVTAVLEDIMQPFNISAALRTLEALGVQDVSVLEPVSAISIRDSITRGAQQWLTISRYAGLHEEIIDTCFSRLRANGYRILVTSPEPTASLIDELDFSRKIAFVFGNERQGVSNYAQERADGSVTIPMVGFTKSFNIATSVGILFYTVVSELKKRGCSWALSPQEQRELLVSWLKQLSDKK